TEGEILFMSSSIPPNEQSKKSNRSLSTASLERPGALRALYERALLSWRLFWDGRVSVFPKLLPIGAVVYLVSPVDILPALAMGPLAPLGALDDIGIILLALSIFIQVAPPDVVKEHLRELGGSLSRYSDNDDVIDGTVINEDE
ncbi:MAG: hypothetical protein JXB30_13610, partial [Anaerolineae bacterium]|nr:hypothetical protein [Anaerolineae bacterium]